MTALDVVQRTVDARASTPPHTTAANSAFNWRGSDASVTAPARTRTTRATKATSPQFQICAVLLSAPANREQLLAQVSASRSAFNNALFQAKATRRVEYDEAGDVYRLTDQGRAWVTGGQRPAGEDRAATDHEVQQTTGKNDQPELDTHPQQPSTRFRCAVSSDGCFLIRNRDGTEMEIVADDFRQMLHYLERMAEPEAT